MSAGGGGNWDAGDAVTVRFGRRGEVRSAVAARVLVDNATGLSLWVAPGADRIESVLLDGRGVRSAPLHERAEAPRRQVRSTWRGSGIVWHAPLDGSGWSVWWFFGADGSFDHWYGNLEAPQRRWVTPGGSRLVDSADRALDVVVAPDGTSRWKDEDEFEAYTGAPGRWDAQQARSIRADGEALRERARAGEPPFDGRWTDFRPDPSWTAPPLPPDWDAPHDVGP